MAEICCGVVSDSEASMPCEGSPRAARRRRMEIRRFKFVTGVVPSSPETAESNKRRKIEVHTALLPASRHEDSVVKNQDKRIVLKVAVRCRERLHELVKEELLESKEATVVEAATAKWKSAMDRSFSRMDKEVIAWNEGVVGASCRCEMQTPECNAVGSTAVVAVVTPDKIIVANCGDSRAVLCRNGKPIPLSTDHKPDRPEEWNRIQAAGGRVIYWDVPRVLGVLAMSRAIGDNYLKPYVSCEPEVTITDRTAEDDCLILASDGLWDVVSNDTACGVARMCLRGKGQESSRVLRQRMRC
ncbi:hypothetical protein GH714_035337 [Hevea brasiliensis]|uniref:PPM-type phosphatase domain-containing protein n=1 Tax=Hevea brasiliensis TaxID=3981 RepID=A0A6A6KRS6_HEVBR|nr:hypothetical protein GH714_035337 [Hevea brasiliensis]